MHDAVIIVAFVLSLIGLAVGTVGTVKAYQRTVESEVDLDLTSLSCGSLFVTNSTRSARLSLPKQSTIPSATGGKGALWVDLDGSLRFLSGGENNVIAGSKYMLRNGTLPMTGNLDVNEGSLLNVAEISANTNKDMLIGQSTNVSEHTRIGNNAGTSTTVVLNKFVAPLGYGDWFYLNEQSVSSGLSANYTIMTPISTVMTGRSGSPVGFTNSGSSTLSNGIGSLAYKVLVRLLVNVFYSDATPCDIVFFIVKDSPPTPYLTSAGALTTLRSTSLIRSVLVTETLVMDSTSSFQFMYRNFSGATRSGAIRYVSWHCEVLPTS